MVLNSFRKINYVHFPFFGNFYFFTSFFLCARYVVLNFFNSFLLINYKKNEVYLYISGSTNWRVTIQTAKSIHKTLGTSISRSFKIGYSQHLRPDMYIFLTLLISKNSVFYIKSSRQFVRYVFHENPTYWQAFRKNMLLSYIKKHSLLKLSSYHFWEHAKRVPATAKRIGSVHSLSEEFCDKIVLFSTYRPTTTPPASGLSVDTAAR